MTIKGSSMHTSVEQAELIEGEVLSVEEVARLCRVSPQWVLARVHAEVLGAQWRQGACYLSSAALWRAREIAALEARYDADPQLAALVADLVEEVRALRSRLALYER